MDSREPFSLWEAREATWHRSIGSVLIIAAWLLVHWSALQWLLRSLTAAGFSQLILLGAVVAGLLMQGWHRRHQWRATLTPSFSRESLGLLLGAAIAGNACRWFLDLEQVSALFLILSAHGLAGFFLLPSLWRQGLPAALLAACLLPFSLQLGTGLEFPARMLTAQAVEHLLAHWQISALSSHDIIVLENGIAHIDLPCSGLKSLWVGTLFLLATTWIEKRSLGFRWLLVATIHLGLLIVANGLRVLLLVLITHVARQPEIAHLLHIPLGVLGFISACGITWGLLHWVPRSLVPTKPLRASQPRPATFKSQVLVVLLLFGLVVVPHPPVSSTTALQMAALSWPSGIKTEPVALTATEQRFFAEDPATMAMKQRWQAGTLSGSMLLVASTSWRAHHAPELCWVGNGFRVDRMERQRFAPSVSARWLSLQGGTQTALYWFQSPQRTTDDLLSRIWSQVSRSDRRWVLVSVQLEQPLPPGDPEVQALVSTIHQTIHQGFQGGSQA
jgi:exosortase O